MGREWGVKEGKLEDKSRYYCKQDHVLAYLSWRVASSVVCASGVWWRLRVSLGGQKG